MEICVNAGSFCPVDQCAVFYNIAIDCVSRAGRMSDQVPRLCPLRRGIRQYCVVSLTRSGFIPVQKY